MAIDFDSKYAKRIKLDNVEYNMFDVKKAASDSGFALEKLPYCLRVLAENVLRHGYGDSIKSFKEWLQNKT